MTNPEETMNDSDSADVGPYPDDLREKFYRPGALRRSELRAEYGVDEATVDEWIESLDEDIVRQRAQEIRSHHRSMSDKKSEVVAWKELGYSDKAIAARVGSSKSTVSGYLDDVAERFGRRAARIAGAPRSGPLDKTTDDTKLNFGSSGDGGAK